MVGFGGVIEPDRELRLLRERAMPCPVLVDEATKLPLRELVLDQRKRRIGESACVDQPIDPRLRRCVRGETHAGLRDHVGHEIGRDRLRVPKLRVDIGPHTKDGQDAIKKRGE